MKVLKRAKRKVDTGLSRLDKKVIQPTLKGVDKALTGFDRQVTQPTLNTASSSLKKIDKGFIQSATLQPERASLLKTNEAVQEVSGNINKLLIAIGIILGLMVLKYLISTINEFLELDAHTDLDERPRQSLF